MKMYYIDIYDKSYDDGFKILKENVCTYTAENGKAAIDAFWDNMPSRAELQENEGYVLSDDGQYIAYYDGSLPIEII